MKYLYISWCVLVFCLLLTACNDDDEEEEDLMGNWVERSNFEGVSRSDAVAFSIGKYAYVGTGYDGTYRLRDFWAYDSENNYWIQVDSFPGVARNSAVAFSVNGKGYVGTGYDGINRLKDFWEYDPESDSWEQKSDFPASARYGAIAFSIGDKGYLGTGYDGNHLKDFWEYDPQTDSWEKMISVGGAKRRDAVAFVIDGKGYVCAGLSNGSYQYDFWRYDPETGLWSELREIDDISDDDYDDNYSITRSDAVAFVMNDKAYITTGTTSSLKSDVWEYQPSADLWEQRTSFEGTARTDAVAFSIHEERGFVTTGRSSSYEFDDIWEFKPDDEYEQYD